MSKAKKDLGQNGGFKARHCVTKPQTPEPEPKAATDSPEATTPQQGKEVKKP